MEGYINAFSGEGDIVMKELMERLKTLDKEKLKSLFEELEKAVDENDLIAKLKNAGVDCSLDNAKEFLKQLKEKTKLGKEALDGLSGGGLFVEFCRHTSW